MLRYADRTYVYDNSVDDAEAKLLFRFVDGKLYKKYVDSIPEWSLPILELG